MLFFGDVSYPLFLVHIQLAWVVVSWLNAHGVGMNPAAGIGIAAVVGVAWAIHVMLKRRSQSADRQVSAALLPPAVIRSRLKVTASGQENSANCAVADRCAINVGMAIRGGMDIRADKAARVAFRSGFRPDIAALRALAVTAVVLFHFGVPGVPGGFVGVDVFFVISGFLMTSILTSAAARGQQSIRGFYAGRVRRIVPALLVVTLCTLAAGYALLLPQPFKQLAWDALGADTFAINMIFARTNDYFAQRADQSWLLHCWSLAVEIQFYLVVPFVVLAAQRLAPRHGVRVGLVAIAAASLAASYVQTRMHATSAFYLPTTRAWEFAAGGLVSTFPQPVAGRRAGAALGLGLILAACALYRASLAYPGLWPLAPVVGTALVIWAREDGRLVSSHPVQYLGDISYSVYLWHWPVLMSLRPLLPGGIIALAAEAAVALGLSALTHRYVETPFRSRDAATQIWPSASIAAGALGVAAASWSVIALAGLPGRIPADIRRVIAVSAPEDEWRSGRCFLRSDQTFADLKPECLAAPGDARPKLMLWGDSTVADLYPGLIAQPWAKNFAVEQATAGSCSHAGSLIAAGLPNCLKFQNDVLGLILDKKPDIVVISMSQNNYYGFDPSSMAIRLVSIVPMADLIRTLKRGGVKQIVVVGPAPVWPDSLPTTFARKSFQDRKMPATLSPPDSDTIAKWSQDIKAAAVGAGAEYIDLYADLCTPDSCLALVPNQPTHSLMQFDEIHFTTKGSDYIANHFIGPALGQPVAASDTQAISVLDTHSANSAGHRTPPAALPQHYSLTLGASFEIDFDIDLAAKQGPYATILQSYDYDNKGFSLEYSSDDRVTLYVRMVDGTVYGADMGMAPGTSHHIAFAAQDGHPRLTVDGTLVAQDDEGRMTQSVGDLWIGGSGLFRNRELVGALKTLSVSGDVTPQ